ncbi:MAG: DNA-directed RNA polymerase subunit alpha [Candidatus Berkelbacteria bacterium]
MDYILPETNLLQIKTMEKIGNAGTFIIEPLSPGYGVTIANSMRRVLLSSLEGAAITSVKIEGATHEFTTVPGVKEDVVEIILNLKTLRFKLHQDEPAVLKLEVKGPKTVTSADFQTNSSCEIVNKDVFLATLDKTAKLSMEITVEKGRGYVPVERRAEGKMPLGTIAVDSIFTPVKKVHYEVENTRVGGMTNFDKITLEIATDGSIDPEEALNKAAGVLVEHFGIIQQAFAPVAKTEKKAKKTEEIVEEEIEEEVEAKPKKTVKKLKK